MSLPEIINIVLWGIIGAIFGSFANVVIYRVPRGLSVVNPPSACGSCGTPIKWYDNIPIFSYLALGGKCRNCHAPYSIRYMLVELIMGLLFAFAAFYFHSFFITLFAAIFIFTLIVLFWIDYEHYILPDIITIPFAILGLIIAAGLDLAFHAGYPFYQTSTFQAIVGATGGYGFFYLLGSIGQMALKKEAMGGGDIKLAAGLGMWLGWKVLIVSVFLASIVGIVIYLILTNRLNEEKHVPFGTALAIGAIIGLFFGNNIIDWYMNLFPHKF